MENYATYCPEDDKIRLYVGRVPRDEYEALRRDGWTSTPKQDCDFVAVWTPSREATALEYSGGTLEDEDQDPTDRAADRAERFAGYREKRTGEALQLADNYDQGPTHHGHQSQALAQRRAARHDITATKACNQWSKAEYWQQRTAGVIANALHRQAPGVRMGRIKKLEAEIRKAEKDIEEAKTRHKWIEEVAADPEKAVARLAPSLPRYYIGEEPEPETLAETFARVALHIAEEITPGYSTKLTHPRHPDRVDSVSALMRTDDDPLTLADVCNWYLDKYKAPDREGPWLQHLRLRLDYENQMLSAQGGRLAAVDIEPGGFLGGAMVVKVSKSPATGRVVSAFVKVPKVEGWNHRKRAGGADYDLLQIRTERLKPSEYREPTDEEREAFKVWNAAAKAEKAARTPKAPPLINPTDEDAQRLQDAINAAAKAERAKTATTYSRDFIPATVCKMTQATYKANSKGSYARAESREICADAIIKPAFSNMYSSKREEYIQKIGPALLKVRMTGTPDQGHDRPDAKRVIVLTDKPQKPLPPEVWPAPQPEPEPTPPPAPEPEKKPEPADDSRPWWEREETKAKKISKVVQMCLF